MFTPGDLALRRAAIVMLACVGAIYVGVKIPGQPFLVLLLLGVAGYVLTLTVNYRWLAWLVIATAPSAILIPALPGRPFLWEACTLAAWPSLAAYFAINRTQAEQLRPDSWERRALVALAGYVLVLVGLMAYRGVGFRVLGGEQMGGRFYLQQILLSILPLLLIAVPPSRSWLLRAVITGWIMALTYLISDFAFATGNRTVQALLYFFEVPVDAINFAIGYETTGLRRYQSLAIVSHAALALLWVRFSLRDLTGRWALAGVPLMLGILAVGLASGHRTLLVSTVLVFFQLSVMQRMWNPVRIVTLLAGGAAVVLALSLWAPRLPLPVQRSISFLPGIEVSALAERDAWTTLNDRVEVLALAVRDVPRYWFWGRGFGLDRTDLIAEDALHTGVELQYLSGFVPNGTLGLLITTGLPGLVCTLVFVWYVSRTAVALLVAVRRQPGGEQTTFDRLCLVICAEWFCAVGSFYLAYGDSARWMQTLALPAALILASHRLSRNEAATVEAAGIATG